jgi:hypothetical protein
VRPLRRRTWASNEPPFLRGQVVGTGQASGLVLPEQALPLRDSAGITPASLGTAPARAQAQAAGSLPQPGGRRRAVASGTRARSSRPLHLIPGGAFDHFGLAIDASLGPTRCHFGCWAGLLRAGMTICVQPVTPRALADDNETDAGGVGTPELTSPRRHLRAGSWPDAPAGSAAPCTRPAGSPVAFST